MKKLRIILFGLLFATVALAQSGDPRRMRIKGKPVTRSQFEYSFNKNNSAGVIDKKSVTEYVPLFIAYKLKVEAALDARLDTLKSFQREFAVYRDQQVRPAMIDRADIENFARRIHRDALRQAESRGDTLKKEFYDYAIQRPIIMRFIDQQGLLEMLVDQKLDSLAKGRGVTPEKILEDKRLSMEAADPNLHYLIKEYHDGLLLYEIARRNVWQKAQEDSLGQDSFFKANRDKYKWSAPHFKGIAYCCRDKEDVQRVKDAVAGQPFRKWAEILRSTFNADSVFRIRAEKGVFSEGMNALVDKMVFGKDTIAKPVRDYPYADVYGRKINAPEEVDDVRQDVIADLQDALEKEWVAKLRKHYKVYVDEKVLATVNKH